MYAFQDAVLDKHGALRRIAFVVDVERAAPVGDRPVVDHRDTLRRNALADPSCKRGGTLAVEVALEPVADRLVQQDARPSRTEHDGHRPGRCVARAEIQQCLVDSPVRILVQYRVDEIAIVDAPAAAAHALFAAPVLLDDDRERKADQRPHIGSDQSIAARDQDRFVFARQRRHDLRDPRVARPRHPLQSLEQRDFFSVGDGGNRVGRRVQRVRAAELAERGHCRLPLASDRARRSRGRRQRFHADVVGIREGGFFTRHRAHTNAAIDRIRAGLDDALLEAPAFDPRVLEVQVGIVDVANMDIGQYLRQLAEFQRRRREEQPRSLVEQLGIDGGEREVGHG